MEPRSKELFLGASDKQTRLDALRQCAHHAKQTEPDKRYINNHIHTTYSFSPYTPSAAAFLAKTNGLVTAGIMDHDSIAGAEEFIEAGKILDLAVTVGLECRVSMKGTPFQSKRTNNPDQIGVSYMTLHAVPHENIQKAQDFFAPLRELRNERNRLMTQRINELISGVMLDFERDILPLSEYENGGTVTERHLMLALAKCLIEKHGRGEPVIKALETYDVRLSKSQAKLMLDEGSPYYEYDLLGILKSAFVPKIFIPADEECLELKRITDFAKEIEAIPCYAYLGDVTSSITGDKKEQRFEDEYLEELISSLRALGIKAITYMPPRNTREQLDNLRALCRKYDMFEISGEDINSPRQEFVCKAMEDPQFANLIDAAWALVSHERGMRIKSLG